MAFYVKVIPPSRRARVHKGECRHCRNGQGQAGQDKGTGPTYWKGPFPKFQKATEFMAGLQYEDVGSCAYCRPAA